MGATTDEDKMVISEIAARSIGIPEPSARFLIALFSGKSMFVFLIAVST